MTTDLIGFLRARLAEDEEMARAADSELSTVFIRIASFDPEMAADERHIMRHDPARVLREVEANRALLDEYASVAVNDLPRGGYEYATGWATGLGFAVRCAASVYADHPDYLEEWRP
ncbi:DUF6221 family protein [Streptomyces sp. NPDC087422]|uniref:DUF6221 family protein n=1 Tax=Streptomyces sp. NPDC087422 TaxID=3365786 RepID=UPI00381A090E